MNAEQPYTPDTEWIRIMVGYAKTTAKDRTLPVEAARVEGYEWFDRWLAAHDAEIRNESEWEYGVRDDAPTAYYGTIVPTADLDEANFGASVDDYMTPVRRRKAGPWEPVS